MYWTDTLAHACLHMSEFSLNGLVAQFFYIKSYNESMPHPVAYALRIFAVIMHQNTVYISETINKFPKHVDS